MKRDDYEAMAAVLDVEAGLPAAPPVHALDLHDLARHKFKPRTPLLGNLIHSQDLMMVYAGRGIGKTHWALSAGFATATGGTFLRWTAREPRKVLYLDGELPGQVMQKRLAMHLPDVEPAPGFFRVFTPDLLGDGQTLPDLARADGQDIINSMIDDDTALVVLDNLSAWARGGGKENDADSWTPIAAWLLALRRRGIAVLLVHHAGKGGDQRGTSKKEDLLDTVVKLARPADYDPREGSVFVMEFTKGRNLIGEDAESLELKLVVDDASRRATWAWNTAEGSNFDRIVRLANDGLRQGDIAVELGLNKSSISRALKKARELGLIQPEKPPVKAAGQKSCVVAFPRATQLRNSDQTEDDIEEIPQ
ncbi:AAA family ATPase [Xenophilus azovorans]|uniref:AAA family ATPase n=1 Tax=Xenophilus azovorans TaxID=151755 RepID=UPI00068AA7C1|nr:AAA family ATPase [Xenophilus azovorans]